MKFDSLPNNVTIDEIKDFFLKKGYKVEKVYLLYDFYELNTLKA